MDNSNNWVMSYCDGDIEKANRLMDDSIEQLYENMLVIKRYKEKQQKEFEKLKKK